MAKFSDEVLTAFLDGEASSDDARAIETALQSDAELGERIAALFVDTEQMQSEYSDLLVDAPAFDASILPSIQKDNVVSFPSRIKALVPMAAAACVAFVVGYGSGRFTEPEKASWVDVVANYQELYTKETLSGYNGWNKDTQVVSVANGLDLQIKPNQLDVDGLQYRYAALLQFGEKPLAQFMFTTADNTPVAICIIKSGAPDKPIEIKTPKGLNAAVWNKGGYGFIVIGDLPESEVIKAAETLSIAI